MKIINPALIKCFCVCFIIWFLITGHTCKKMEQEGCIETSTSFDLDTTLTGRYFVISKPISDPDVSRHRWLEFKYFLRNEVVDSIYIKGSYSLFVQPNITLDNVIFVFNFKGAAEASQFVRFIDKSNRFNDLGFIPISFSNFYKLKATLDYEGYRCFYHTYIEE
jgi:hypothetical protein